MSYLTGTMYNTQVTVTLKAQTSPPCNIFMSQNHTCTPLSIKINKNKSLKKVLTLKSSPTIYSLLLGLTEHSQVCKTTCDTVSCLSLVSPCVSRKQGWCLKQFSLRTGSTFAWPCTRRVCWASAIGLGAPTLAG